MVALFWLNEVQWAEIETLLPLSAASGAWMTVGS
jgi:hypothetical protein